MDRRRVPSKPRRRVYKTGGTVPALTSNFRPIPLGLDEAGETDGQIRAFAVNVRNLSDSPIYIREGPEGDEAKIARFEHYTIWESNGINSLSLRGENGDEQAELRVLEAHNDFSIRDKIDAFVRAVSHFFAQSKTEAVITGSEVVFDTKITDATGVNFDTEITGVAGGVNFDTTITDIQTLEDLNVAINAQNVGNLTTDISAQSVGDLNVMDIEGTPVKRYFYGNLHTPAETTTEWDIEVPATEDGFIQFIGVRFFENDEVFELDEMGVRLMINGTNVLPREHRATRNIAEFSRAGRSADIQRYDEKNECNFVIEPLIPFKFRKGDNVQIRAAHETEVWGPPIGGETYIVEITVQYVLREET